MQTSETSATADQGPDVISLLEIEHAALRAGLARVTSARAGLARREHLHEFAKLLVRHDVAEETVVYPVLARIQGGEQFRDEALRQERGVTIALARLLRRFRWRPGGRKSLRQVQRFSVVLEDHLAFEERSLIPILSALENEQMRHMMGTWLRRAAAVAPTRPHPHGPQRPAGLLTIGLAIGVVDRLADRAAHRRAGPAARNSQ